MLLFRSKALGKLKNPIFIIGENPGKQRKNCNTTTVWEGNRSGDFLKKTLEGKENIYLTNIYNVLLSKQEEANKKLKQEVIRVGLEILLNDIQKHKPRKIICLGNFAYNCLKNILVLKNYKMIKLKHPSFILRFNKDRKGYKEKILHEIDKI